MANKPFTSRCINVHNETTSKTIPHAFGLNNVTATQIHDRSISDTVSTCIASNLQPQMPYNNHFYYNCNSDNCNYFNKPQVTYAQPQIIPGGVAFGFNPEPLLQENNIQSFSIGGPPGNPRLQTRQAYQNIFQEPLTLEQQIGLKRLEKQRLELMQIQEYLKKYPCKPQFQHNGQTSITDSNQSQIPLAHGMPDLTNAVAHLADLRKNLASLSTEKLSPDELPPNQLYPEVYKAKRLLLTKSPDLLNKSKRPLFTDEDIESCKSDQQTSSTSKLSPDEEKSKQADNTNKDIQSESQENCEPEETASTARRVSCDDGMPDLTNAVVALADLRKKLQSQHSSSSGNLSAHRYITN